MVGATRGQEQRKCLRVVETGGEEREGEGGRGREREGERRGRKEREERSRRREEREGDSVTSPVMESL